MLSSLTTTPSDHSRADQMLSPDVPTSTSASTQSLVAASDTETSSALRKTQTPASEVLDAVTVDPVRSASASLRMQKIEKLMSQVQNNTYRVSTSDLADALLQKANRKA